MTLKENFYYCQIQIEQGKWCKTQCEHCKKYYKPLEDERKEKDYESIKAKN